MATYDYERKAGKVGDHVELTLSIAENVLDELLQDVWDDYCGDGDVYPAYSVHSMLMRVGVKQTICSELYQELHSEITKLFTAEAEGGPKGLTPEQKMEALSEGRVDDILEYGHCCCHGTESIAEYLEDKCNKSDDGIDMTDVWERVEEALEEYIGDTPPKDVTKDSITHTAKLAAQTVTKASSR